MADSHRTNIARSGIPTTAAPNVRRNLFSSQSSRSSAGVARSNSATLADSVTEPNNSDIVVRNPDGGYQFSTTPPPPAETTPTPEQEADMKLAEMLSNRSRQSSEAELLNALKAGLRRKVASLEDDRWMFGGGGRS